MIGTWRQKQALDGLGGGLAGDPVPTAKAVQDAIEVATTVKITQDALDELIASCPPSDVAGRDQVQEDMHEGAVAFLKSLGFEVVQ